MIATNFMALSIVALADTAVQRAKGLDSLTLIPDPLCLRDLLQHVVSG